MIAVPGKLFPGFFLFDKTKIFNHKDTKEHGGGRIAEIAGIAVIARDRKPKPLTTEDTRSTRLKGSLRAGCGTRREIGKAGHRKPYRGFT
jgi:hypothetical protein